MGPNRALNEDWGGHNRSRAWLLIFDKMVLVRREGRVFGQRPRKGTKSCRMRFEVQLKGYQGQLEESQDQQKGSEGKSEGCECLGTS